MKDIFGNDIIDRNTIPKKKENHSAIVAHLNLIQIYGKSEGNKCKSCEHLIVKKFGKKYFKCSKFKDSASLSSDWRANWQACGLHKTEI